jgi:glycosyltransferase involved in cell wall biosynthesis
MPDSFPLVSIGLPVYNGAAYLTNTLNSVKLQAYPNLELIIVDDGSTDESFEICREWIINCGLPVKLTRNEKNKGLPSSCNILLQKVAGKYFQILGQDDILLPGKIADDVNIFEQQPAETALIFSKVKLIDEKGSFKDEDYFERISYDGKLNELIFEQLVQKNFIPAPTALVKTEMVQAIGGYDESLLFEDWDMWLRLSKDYKVVFNDVCNVHYRIHHESMMANRDEEQTIRRNEANVKMFNKHIGYSPEFDLILYRKLKELTIYSFFIGDTNAKSKMMIYLKHKADFKIGLYLLMALLGIKHPSRLFRSV